MDTECVYCHKPLLPEDEGHLLCSRPTCFRSECESTDIDDWELDELDRRDLAAAGPGGTEMNQLEQQEQDHWASQSDQLDNLMREQ